MVETAAHLNDQVFPQVPVRQWVLSFPKRLRYFLARDADLLNRVLRIFLNNVEKIFTSERLQWVEKGQRLVYHLPKPGPDGHTVLYLTPLEFASIREGTQNAPCSPKNPHKSRVCILSQIESN